MRHRTSRLVPVAQFGVPLLVGIAVGWYAVGHMSTTANAIVISVIGAILLLSNFVVRLLNEAFTENLKTAKTLESRRYAAFVAYISARRFDVNVGYLVANFGGGLCEIAALTRFAESHIDIPAGIQTGLFIVAYSVSLTALPYLLRSVNYWRLLDGFRYEIDTLVAEQARRKERMASLPRPTAK